MTRSVPGDEVVFTEELSGRCPCGGTFQAGHAKTPRDPNEPQVLHSLPICEKYEQLDLPEYLAYVRKAPLK